MYPSGVSRIGGEMPVYEIQVGPRKFSFLHVHVPKTGGVAVSHYFTARLGAKAYFGYEMNPVRPLLRCHPHHYHYALLRELFVLEKATCSFCIVRHPVARIQSDYIWAMSRPDMKDHWMSFDDWVRYVFDGYRRDPYFAGNHIRPQHEFIGPHVRNVFRLEHGLENAVSNALKLAGLATDRSVVLDRVNTRSELAAGGRLSVDMTEETRRKIVEFYRDDFIRFGYSP